MKSTNSIHGFIKLLIMGFIFLSLLPGGFVQDAIKIDHFFSSHHMFEYAFRHGFIFGTNLIDNVGPYGFLHYPFVFTGDTFWLKIGWYAAIALIYAYYAMLLTEKIKTLPEKLLFLFAIIFFPLQILNPWYAFEILPRLAVLFSALYFLIYSSKKNATHIIAHIILNGVFYALLVLEKASNVYYLLILTTVLSIYWITRRQGSYALYLLGTFFSAIMILWLAAGQPLSALPTYFESMRFFIDSYQNIFSFDMQANLFKYTFSYCMLIALILLVRMILSAFILPSGREFYQSLLIAVLVFLAWKHGMLRGALSYGTLLYLIPCILAYILFMPIEGQDTYKGKNPLILLIVNRFYFIATCGLFTVFLFIFWHSMSRYEQTLNLHRTLSQEFTQRISALISYHPIQTRRHLNEKIEVLKRNNTLSASLLAAMKNKTIDEFGDTPEIIFLNNLRYSPRPTPINFIVGNPALNRKNGQFYQQVKTAPDFVLLRDFGFQLADTSAYLSLLLNYHVRENAFDWLVLEKNTQWHHISLNKILNQQASFNEWVSLSQRQSFLIWVQIHVTPTSLGKLKSFLYKSEKVRLDIRLNNGVTQHYDTSLAQLDSGFLINPIIKSKDPTRYNDDTHLDIPWEEVKAFRIVLVSKENQVLFQSQYQIVFSHVSMSLPHAHPTPLTLTQAKKQLTQLRKNAIPYLKPMSLHLLAGKWQYQNEPTNITILHHAIFVRNEKGSVARGVLSKDHLFLVIPGWGNIKARLSKDGKTLIWRNGSIWSRTA